MVGWKVEMVIWMIIAGYLSSEVEALEDLSAWCGMRDSVLRSLG